MKICPKCGSKNIDWLNPQDAAVWECKDCNHTGIIIEGSKKVADEINKGFKFNMKNQIFKK